MLMITYITLHYVLGNCNTSYDILNSSLIGYAIYILGMHKTFPVTLNNYSWERMYCYFNRLLTGLLIVESYRDLHFLHVIMGYITLFFILFQIFLNQVLLF